MRLLIDAHVFDGKFQGSRTYLLELYLAFLRENEKNGNKFSLFFASNNTAGLADFFPPSDVVHHLKLPKCGTLRRLLIEFPILIRKNKIDLAHFQYVIPFFPFCKYINTIHDLLFLDYPEYFTRGYVFSRAWIFRRSYKRSEFVLTISEFAKHEIVSHFGGSKTIVVLPNAVPHSLLGFVPFIDKKNWLSLKKVRPYILCVSRFEPRKNQHSLLRTFIAARLYKDYDLVLIGARSEPYKDFDQLRSSLTNTQQQSVICLNDGVDNESLLVWLKHSEIVVYPSLAEGFGLPPLEAYILGCNVICFNNTAMLAFDFLEEGLIKDDQLQVVLPQALNLLKEGVLSRFPVRYQPEKVFENYSWERNAKIFYHLLTEKGKTRERNGIS